MQQAQSRPVPGDVPVPTLDEGLAHHEAGRLADAEIVYRQILARDPDHADGLHLFGLLAYQVGRAEIAVEYIGRAVLLQPSAVHYRSNLGNALFALGRVDDAEACHRAALHMRPNSPEMNSNLGAVLQALGRRHEAALCYLAALRLKPKVPNFYYNLGTVLRDADLSPVAQLCYLVALRLQPDHVDALYNLGTAVMEDGRLDVAQQLFCRALQLRPNFPDAYNNLGSALQYLGHPEAAEACYQTALQLKPDDADAHYNLGTSLLAQNRPDEARLCYDRAVTLKPDHGAARVARCMTHLPILYADAAEVVRRRQAYDADLRQLAADIEHHGDRVDFAAGIGAVQPFLLPYQGHDDRELQRLYGGLVSGLLSKRLRPPAPAAAPAESEKVRLGIVSGFFRRHTVWQLLIKGWLGQLDRRRFEIFGYHTAAEQDGATAGAAALCDRFVQGPLSLPKWQETIAADRPHVLIYPEIGMDPMAARLAALRLARVQCNAWGQPETSGLPSIDYFISSDLMEPAGAEAHYTERLVRLPHLSIYYEPSGWTGPARDAIGDGRAAFGLRAAATVYWSGQSLSKYLPQFDSVFPRIARQAGDCQFVFIEYAKSQRVTALFRRRLEAAFAAEGMNADKHCVILPHLPPQRFVAAIGHCDIVLDTPGWSGGHSTLESLANDLPIVTMPGPLMRSRHTAAILTRMGVPDTIVSTIDEYVAMAVRLGCDSAWRTALITRIALGKQRLYRDRDCILALEEFLIRAARAPI